MKLDEISNELKEISIDYVGHGVINEKGEHTGYFSHKEWGNIYINKGYFFIDPVLEVFNQCSMKIIDWFVVGNMIKDDQILGQRARCTGIVSGITLVSSIQNHTEFLNLGFSRKICTTKYLAENYMVLKSYMTLFRRYHTYQRTR